MDREEKRRSRKQPSRLRVRSAFTRSTSSKQIRDTAKGRTEVRDGGEEGALEDEVREVRESRDHFDRSSSQGFARIQGKHFQMDEMHNVTLKEMRGEGGRDGEEVLD